MIISMEGLLFQGISHHISSHQKLQAAERAALAAAALALALQHAGKKRQDAEVHKMAQNRS